METPADPIGEAQRPLLAGVLTRTRPLTLVGLEHEYQLTRDGRAVDFRSLIHELPIAGRRVDPGDANCYRCESGIALTCDDAEAEIATPPIPVDAGFASELDTWAARAQAELVSVLPPEVDATGYSTHLSLAMSNRLNDRACALFAQTFAPAFMLLTDRASSFGIFVRPRPGRMEVCGEFVSGRQLRLAATFLLGAARACVAILHGSRGLPRPPQIAIRLNGSEDRFGLYVDRRKVARDFYAAPRTATLRLVGGGAISGQAYLEAAWASARAALGDDADPADLRLLDAVIAGELPLGVEQGVEPSEAPVTAEARDRAPDDALPGRAPPSPFGLAARVRRRGALELRPWVVTWDFAVFRVAREGDRPAVAFAAVPRALLASFLGRFERGALDRGLSGFLATGARRARPRRRLAHRVDAMRPGLFDSVAPAEQLVAEERPPEAAAYTQPRSETSPAQPVTASVEPLRPRTRERPRTEPAPAPREDRPGKYERPRTEVAERPAQQPSRTGTGCSPALIALAVIGVALAAIAVFVLLGGGGGDEQAQPTETSGATSGTPGVARSATSGAGDGGRAVTGAVPEDLLGTFGFIGDGVIEFKIEGDRIIGRTLRPPLSTGIELVGGAVPCPEFASDVVFSLDLTGVGEWYWYDSSPCVRAGAGAVTVVFSTFGADATGLRPETHPDYDGVPTVHAMPRVEGVPGFNPTPITVVDAQGDVRNQFGEMECVDRSGGSPVDRGVVIDVLGGSLTPREDGAYLLELFLAGDPTASPADEVSVTIVSGALFEQLGPDEAPGSGPVLGALVWQQLFPFGGPPAAVDIVGAPIEDWATIEESGMRYRFVIEALPDDVDAVDLGVMFIGGFIGQNGTPVATCADSVLVPAFR